MACSRRLMYCRFCESYDCVREYRFGSPASVAQGVAGVWHALDRVWSDLLAIRPAVKPLTRLALDVRWEVLRDRPVRVITAGSVSIGIFRRYRCESGGEPSVVVGVRQSAELSTDELPVVIPAAEILDILPYRL